ncbi:MAG: hypothetical protein ACRDDF_10490 [Aeromonas sp.]
MQQELERLRDTLLENGYPLIFIDKYSTIRPSKDIEITVTKKPVYMKLTFKGDDVTGLIKQCLTAAIEDHILLPS